MTQLVCQDPDATHVNVGGTEYVANEDGLFDIDNSEHATILKTMGFHEPGAQGVVLPPVSTERVVENPQGSNPDAVPLKIEPVVGDAPNFTKMNRGEISAYLAERGVTMAPTESKDELIAAAQAAPKDPVAPAAG